MAKAWSALCGLSAPVRDLSDLWRVLPPQPIQLDLQHSSAHLCCGGSFPPCPSDFFFFFRESKTAFIHSEHSMLPLRKLFLQYFTKFNCILLTLFC